MGHPARDAAESRAEAVQRYCITPNRPALKSTTASVSTDGFGTL